MYLSGAFFSGLVKRQMEKIVAVEIVMVIVLLSGGAGATLA